MQVTSQFSLFLTNLHFSLCSSMNEVVHTSPTIGSNVEEIVVNNTRFLMWDIGGQESLRSSWNTYYTNTEVRMSVLLEDLVSPLLVKGGQRTRNGYQRHFQRAVVTVQ